ncbi:hypothetical protein L914_03763, partial [Phytophthora nicotianae]
LACKGLLRRPESPDFNKVSDRSTVEWKTNDLKAIGVIAGDVSLTYQVYIREALTAAETWMLLKEHSNKKALKNWLLVTKKFHSFMIKPSTMFAVHVDNLADEFRMSSTLMENTPNVTLPYAIQTLAGDETTNSTEPTKFIEFITGTLRYKNMHVTSPDSPDDKTCNST